jgi:hypothetical protein
MIGACSVGTLREPEGPHNALTCWEAREANAGKYIYGECREALSLRFSSAYRTPEHNLPITK